MKLGQQEGLIGLVCLWCMQTSINEPWLQRSAALIQAAASSASEAGLHELAAKASVLAATEAVGRPAAQAWFFASAATHYSRAGLQSVSLIASEAALEAAADVPVQKGGMQLRASCLADRAERAVLYPEVEDAVLVASAAQKALDAHERQRVSDLPYLPSPRFLRDALQSVVLRSRFTSAVDNGDTAALRVLMEEVESELEVAIAEFDASGSIEDGMTVAELLSLINMGRLATGTGPTEEEVLSMMSGGYSEALGHLLLPALGPDDPTLEDCELLAMAFLSSFDGLGSLWTDSNLGLFTALRLSQGPSGELHDAGMEMLLAQLQNHTHISLAGQSDRDRRLRRVSAATLSKLLADECIQHASKASPDRQTGAMTLALITLDRARCSAIVDARAQNRLLVDASAREQIDELNRLDTFENNAKMLGAFSPDWLRRSVPRSVVKYVQDTLPAAQARKAVLVDQLASVSPEVASLYSVAELPELSLPMGTKDVVLVFHAGMSALACWCITAEDGIRWTFRTDLNASDLDAWADQTREAVAACPRWSTIDQFVPRDDLGQWLLSMVPAGTQRLYAVVPPELSDVPLEVLPIPDGTRAAQSIAVSYAPSLLWLSSVNDEAIRRQDAQRVSGGETLLVVSDRGGKVGSRTLPELKTAMEEAVAVVRGFRNERAGERQTVTVLTSDAARIRTVIREAEVLPFGREAFAESAVRASTVYVGAHGIVVPGEELNSFFLLGGRSGSNRLMARDLMSLRLEEANIVLLSACSSLRVAFDKADEPIGLVRPFLLAGAVTVVGPTMDVRPDIALRLVQGYAAKIRSDGKTSAFFNARNRMLFSDDFPPAEVLAWRYTGVMDDPRPKTLPD